ncbi:sensitivity to red light reduced protein [Actinidia rufa]|uniref:Sensitivity to red light reduced protein n=1 Tax=Actinidia rufa TaxID=165716 RepID=A0A7J0ES65_9ERIC|nr:sensitivity to red light reduced protein [Actinidia rufa]
MAASAKTLTLEKPNVTGDWTIVLPRHRKQRRNFIKSRMAEQGQPWIKFKLLKSWIVFLGFLGSEPKMQMVIYGIGSIESYETPRLQLALAILMKKRLSWIGDMEVFDPILSATETRVLETLGGSVLSVNEQGRRQALKPTLFFMPHCEAELYDNLLQANWRVDMLKRVVLFGNSFETYEQYVSVFKNSTVINLRKHILAVRRFTKEAGIKTVSDDYFRAFHDLSWHFFQLRSRDGAAIW